MDLVDERRGQRHQQHRPARAILTRQRGYDPRHQQGHGEQDRERHRDQRDAGRGGPAERCGKQHHQGDRQVDDPAPVHRERAGTGRADEAMLRDIPPTLPSDPVAHLQQAHRVIRVREPEMRYGPPRGQRQNDTRQPPSDQRGEAQFASHAALRVSGKRSGTARSEFSASASPSRPASWYSASSLTAQTSWTRAPARMLRTVSIAVIIA